MNEVLIVLVIAVIVIGPRQLPQVARAMGKMVAQFKRATNELRDTISDEVNEHIPTDELNEIRDSLESGVSDLKHQSYALADDEFDKDKKIGREVAEDLRSAMSDIPSEVDFATGNGGDPKKKPRKRMAAKGAGKSKAVAAATGRSPAKKTTAAKRSGKGSGVTKGAAANAAVAKSAGKVGAKSRQGGRA